MGHLLFKVSSLTGERASKQRLFQRPVPAGLGVKGLTLIIDCFRTLAVLRKLKHMAPYHVRKQMAGCLVISKLDYASVLFNPLTAYQL